MAANSTIDLTSLDFDTLKASMVNYLSSQDRFKDYDFTGSNFNVLLDILSYNTYLNSFYLNMVASEAFLDTAQLETSVFSHAKELNYLPRSAGSAKATVGLSFQTKNNSGTIIIPKGTSFTARVGLNSYNFYTDSTQVYHSTNTYIDSSSNIITNWSIGPLDIYEGAYVSDTFGMNYSDLNQRFIMTNSMVDTSTITVTSVEDNGINYIPYLKKSTLLDLNAASKAYFVQGAETGMFEIVFGDGVIGRRPQDGATILVQYRISSGMETNGAKGFTINQDITDSTLCSQMTVVTNNAAQGGTEKESVSSVKFNAPRYFQTQERAVSTADYETLLKSQFPEINVVAIYGGETRSPPRYGKVIVSVDISNVQGFPDSKKQAYYDFLKPRMPLTTQPIFISPSHIYYSINSVVRYNVNLTKNTPSEIATLVKNSIISYNNNNLNKFNSVLRYSQLAKTIDSSDVSVVGNETEIYMYKKIYPKFGVAQNITVNFNVPLLDTLFPIGAVHPITDLHTIYSTEFTYQGQSAYLEDDADGNVRIVKSNGLNHETIKTIGTVDYAKGIVNLVNFNIDLYSGPELKIYAISAEKDIYAGQNDILNLEANEINLVIQAIRE